MKSIHLKPTLAALAVPIVAALAAAPAYALANNGLEPDSNVTTSGAAQQARLNAIISAGNREISRRLNTLGSLDSRINSAAKLTSGDKSSLASEVSSEQSGLNSLKTSLDAATTVSSAGNDAKSIISDYRVYALVVPKVWLVKAADDQQVVESKLSTLAGKLQSRINQAKSQGKDVTALQSALDDLNSQVSAAQSISSSVESKVLALQPSDYNSDHSILSGYRGQLQTAHADNQKALNDAKTIVNGLKNL